MDTLNKQVLLASRPQGAVTEDNFRFVEAPVGKPGPGEVLVKNEWLSLDPYMRGRMSDSKSYAKSTGIGEVMVGQTVGEVVESHDGNFKAGDKVLTPLGWQLYGIASAKDLTKIDTPRVPASYYLGVLGADYNATEPYGYKLLRSVLVNRIRMQSLIVFDWKDRYGEALKGLSGYLAEGKLKYRESIVEGIDNAPKGFIALLKGENFGKQLVKLA